MKKLLLTLTGLLFSVLNFAQSDDPVVLTINGDDIHESEFWYIYSKNNPDPSTKKADLDSYMELFINYKLKVKEAEELGYDTIPYLSKELDSYRKQLSWPYMIDKEKNEELIKEAYERTTHEIRVSHILIRVGPNATAEDTLNAYNKCLELRKRILNGEDFADVAKGKNGSQDPSVQKNGGDLGYFGALQMVYPFEEAAFTTKIGDISMPVKTKFGYHIIKVHDLRESRGKIKTAHIMILMTDEMSREQKTDADRKIKEIYELLEKGEKFEDLAKKYSDDKSSASQGGMLPEFGAGAKQRMVPEFEEAAFAISEDGQYSKPIKSSYGYHIIKRIELTPVASYEELYKDLKMRVEKDIRAQTTKSSFLNKIKKEYGFKDNSGDILPEFVKSIGEKFHPGKWEGLSPKMDRSQLLFSFKNVNYTVGDFEIYFKELTIPSKSIPMYKFVQEQYDLVVKTALTDYEDSILESKYPEFKSLMQEYRDGILVFEIMQNEVWKKATKDSAGIQNYFDTHREDFTYPVRYKGELYKCKDKSTAQEVYGYLESDTMSYGQIQDIVNKDSQLNLVVKSQIFNSESTDAFKKGKKVRKFKNGLNKIYALDGEYYVFKVEEVQAPRKREFSEAKGLVTAAYQNQLEKDWIQSLRSKYKIEIHSEALYNVGN